MAYDNQKGGFLPGLIIGGLLAGTAVFLLGTEEGKKVAKDLKKKTKKWLDEAEKTLEDVAIDHKEMMGKVGEAKDAVIKQVKEDAEKIVDLAKEQKEDLEKRFFTKGNS